MLGAGAATLIVAILMVKGVGGAPPAEPASPEDRYKAPGTYAGSVSCSECHTKPRGAYLENGGACEFVLATEYAVWKVYDKHSRAYFALEGKRGQKMAELLGQDVREAATGCLNCHSMNRPKAAQGDRFSKEDGVSCSGCHGPDKGWVDKHNKPAWRERTAEDKKTLGMLNLRDPAVKSELCLSCHVGNAAEGKVVTHAMFAAGHPALPPIEIATFTRNEPQHWRDAVDVPYFQVQKDNKQAQTTYDLPNAAFQRTKLMIVGNVVSLRETMRLAATRANLNNPDAATIWPELGSMPGGRLRERWPELAMAHSDCYGCHHDLQSPSPRQQRGYGYRLGGGKMVRAIPGRPLVRAWPLALIDLGIECSGQPGKLDELAGQLDKLMATCNATVFGKPEEVESAAQGVVGWCDQMLGILDAPGTKYDSALALRMLHRLGNLDAINGADYETAREIGGAFQVVYEEWSRTGKGDDRQALKKDLKDLADYLNLQPYSQRDERLTEMLKAVKAVTGSSGEGASQFEEYVTKERGNPEWLPKLVKNKFLQDLQDMIPSNFDKELVKPAMATRLQELNEKELTNAYQKLSAYNPEDFKAKMKSLCSKLPKVP
jgi:hypothetical protein